MDYQSEYLIFHSYYTSHDRASQVFGGPVLVMRSLLVPE